MGKTIVGADFDYRLSEKQLDSEFDLYFNTGGFFSDANSSTTATSDIPQPITTNQVVKEMNPLSPSGFNKKQLSKQSNHQRMPKSKQPNQRMSAQKGKKIKNVRPSPLMHKKGKKSKKN